MPRLTENVLIGARVRLAGEDISEVDAKGVRPEVFAVEDALAADEPAKSSRARGKSASTK